MKLSLTPFHFEELIKRGYSVDVVFILRMVHEQINFKVLCEENDKIAALYQSLIRKGLITEENNITTMGQELLSFMDSKIPRKIARNKTDETDFKKWWLAYPGTDTFEYGGRQFAGARSLRVNETSCRQKFDEIILEGKFTANELIEALQYDVLKKKELSYKRGENKLSYMQNSLTYLNQRSFIPFIELLKSGTANVNAASAIITPSRRTTDI